MRIDELLKDRSEMKTRLVEMDKKLEAIIASASSKPTVSRTKPSFEKREFMRVVQDDSSELKEGETSSRASYSTPAAKRLATYPNSDVVRVPVTESKKPWGVEFEEYAPSQFTARHVLTNMNADTNFMNM
jgi:hypothetical protein